jgi:hypothetical protein
LNGPGFWFSNSDMSYETKSQKTRPEANDTHPQQALPSGVALSTLLWDEDEITQETEQPAQPPSTSTANDAD